MWLNSRDKRLMWPDDPECVAYMPRPSFQREIQVLRDSLQPKRIDPRHQWDATTRDYTMALEDTRAQKSLPKPGSRRILPRPKTLVKILVLEEQDSGYETDDSWEVPKPSS